MKVLLFIFSSVYLCLNLASTPSYQVKYHLLYHPDSTNLKLSKSEIILLYTKNEGSSCASENRFKSDSIKLLVKKGVLSVNDIMDSRNRYKTNFKYFVHKDYLQKENQIYETISVQNYAFSTKNELKWIIGTEKDTLSGYSCVKATVSYAGRDYEAWFVPEIPISDGPYIFWGLPGLIVKLNDTRNHYIFTMVQLKEYDQEIMDMPVYVKQQPLQTDRIKAFSMREDARKDPLGYFSRTTGVSFDNMTFSRNGSSESIPSKSAQADRSWDNNPLELKSMK